MDRAIAQFAFRATKMLLLTASNDQKCTGATVERSIASALNVHRIRTDLFSQRNVSLRATDEARLQEFLLPQLTPYLNESAERLEGVVDYAASLFLAQGLYKEQVRTSDREALYIRNLLDDKDRQITKLMADLSNAQQRADSAERLLRERAQTPQPIYLPVQSAPVQSAPVQSVPVQSAPARPTRPSVVPFNPVTTFLQAEWQQMGRNAANNL